MIIVVLHILFFGRGFPLFTGRVTVSLHSENKESPFKAITKALFSSPDVSFWPTAALRVNSKYIKTQLFTTKLTSKRHNNKGEERKLQWAARKAPLANWTNNAARSLRDSSPNMWLQTVRRAVSRTIMKPSTLWQQKIWQHSPHRLCVNFTKNRALSVPPVVYFRNAYWINLSSQIR